MNFDFIPFQLNSDMASFKGQIDFISSDNGVELYKVRQSSIEPVLGFKVSEVNLYFFEVNLVTVYIRLDENISSIEKVKEVVDIASSTIGEIMKANSEMLYYWHNKNQFLGLLVENERNFIILYFSQSKFNIFNQ